MLLSVLLLILTAFARWRSKDEDANKAEEFPRLQFMASTPKVDGFMPILNPHPNPGVDDAFGFEEFTSTVTTTRHQCAACFSTATTRCSRCKAVRYCSSKCQIMHWRQGHKHECRPQVPSELERGDLSGKAEVVGQSKINGIDSADGLPKMNNKGTVDQAHGDDSDSHIMMPRLSTVTIDSSDRTVGPNSPTEQEGLVSDAKSHNVVQEEKSNTLDAKSPDLGHSEKKLNKERLRRSATTKPRVSNLSPSFKRYNSSGGADYGDLRHSKSKEVPGVKHLQSIERGEHKDLANKHFDSSVSLTRNGGSSSYVVHNGIKSSLKKAVQQLKTSSQKKPSVENSFVETLENRDCKVVFQYDIFMRLYSSNEVELKPFGLVNCGNSCYANAVLQCLIYTRPLTLYLLQGLHSRECWREGWCFICEFEHLISKGREGNSPLSPIRILAKISHLGHGRQEDAHEFLRYAVDTMQSICIEQARFAGPVAEETTLIGMTFGGYLHSKIKCMNCCHKSEKYERMMDLTVEIGGDIRTLEQALKRFTASEILQGENKYYCSRCKSYEKAKKKLTVSQAPNILTIVLKRFKAGNFTKLNKPVRFPEILDMTPYMSGFNDRFPQYSLYGVVVHLDVINAAVSGHYVCYVKNYFEEWFKIDDSVVISVDLERVLSEEAYMLLYARHSPRLPASMRNSFDHKGSETHLQAVPRRSNVKSAIPKARRHSSDLSADPSVMQHQSSRNGHMKNPSCLEEWVTQSVESIPLMDSSSEASSLFSFSEEGTCSTPSTKDSASLEDFSDYIFGRGCSRR